MATSQLQNVLCVTPSSWNTHSPLYTCVIPTQSSRYNQEYILWDSSPLHSPSSKAELVSFLSFPVHPLYVSAMILELPHSFCFTYPLQQARDPLKMPDLCLP